MIVRLALDPSQFAQGERQMVESLRRMENAAERGAQRTTAVVSRGAIDFFRTIESPIAGLRRQFEMMATWTVEPQRNLQQLSEQGQQTGATIARSMGTATAGVRAFGIAGLAAFAAYETLNKTLQTAGGIASRVLGQGIGAAAAGTGVQQFAAAVQAFAIHGHIPPEEVGAFLSGFGVMQEQRRRGLEPGTSELVRMHGVLARYRIGVSPLAETDPEQFLIKLSRAMARMTPQEAAAVGDLLRMSPGMAYGLRREGARNIEADIARERGRAPTEENLARAEKLRESMDNLKRSTDRLGEVVMLNAGVAGGLASGINALADTIASITGGTAPSREDWLHDWLGSILTPDWAPGGWLGPKQSGAAGAISGGAGQPLSSVVSGGQTDQLTDYIIRHEGGSLAGVRNNPGNIKYTGAPGQTDSGVRARDGGTFASYATPEEGRAAIGAQINRAASGLSTAYGPRPTVSDFLSKYSGGGYSGGDLSSPSPVPQIQRSHATSNVTNTVNHGDINVGGVTVNAPTREADAIGRSVADQIRNLGTLAVPANRGFQ